jgi:hypothetical protein
MNAMCSFHTLQNRSRARIASADGLSSKFILIEDVLKKLI